MIADDDVRIGFYICHCGRNIADTVDVEVLGVGLLSNPVIAET